MIASTGQARMHLVQPMQSFATMCAKRSGCSVPQAGSSGLTGRPVSRASVSIPACPPGGQRLMSASPLAIASA